MSGFNKQGRAVSESMRLNEFKRYCAAQKPAARHEENYRGFAIARGYRGAWIVTETGCRVWPASFSSLAKARAAVDRCHEIRAEVEAVN